MNDIYQILSIKILYILGFDEQKSLINNWFIFAILKSAFLNTSVIK